MIKEYKALKNLYIRRKLYKEGQYFKIDEKFISRGDLKNKLVEIIDEPNPPEYKKADPETKAEEEAQKLERVAKTKISKDVDTQEKDTKVRRKRAPRKRQTTAKKESKDT